MEIKAAQVICKTNQEFELHAPLVRLTRHAAIFEAHGAGLVLRASEVLADFRIVAHDRPLYAGRAVVQNVVSNGSTVLCEVALTETAWRDVDFCAEAFKNGKLQGQFRDFLQEWEKLYRVDPQFKLVVADMASFFFDLRLWLDQVELGLGSPANSERTKLENQLSLELAKPVLPCLDVFFEKFELIAERLEKDLVPAHRSYARRLLHPYLLGSPFVSRTFEKPLGYAGDYEMVNMILRNGQEGGSLFAKVVNTWFLRQAPAEAHRNRIAYLIDILQAEALRARRQNRLARCFSVACGPCQEVQAFLRQTPASDHAHLTLLDFNQETLQYARDTIDTVQQEHGRRTQFTYVHKSVQQVLKESGRATSVPAKQYDFVYCAGLFDYLSDPICQRLMNIMYEWVAPGGLLVATNVDRYNPMRNVMEHLLDWNLIYRTAAQMQTLAPTHAPQDTVEVRADVTGVNVFLEVRKPDYEGFRTNRQS